MSERPSQPAPPKSPAESAVVLSHLMGPNEANGLGNVHGGVILRFVDEAGALAVMRHSRRPCVTVRLDSMTFLQPVSVSEFVTFRSQVNWVGRSSMEVGVHVEAENPITGEITHTNSAYVVYVALDDAGHPAPVPPLSLTTPDEQRRWDEAVARQAHRLAQRQAKA
jgi:acyl-CoA hydrolase